MTHFYDLTYISRTGLTAAFDHPQDNPYEGKPHSKTALAVLNDCPSSVTWIQESTKIRKDFTTGIQAARDPDNPLLIVIGHWGSNLDGYPMPNNGVVYKPDGSVHRQITVPPYIVGKRYNDGRPIPPDCISLAHVRDGRLILWLAYWDGDWHEQRIYNAFDGTWGDVVGQYRAN